MALGVSLPNVASDLTAIDTYTALIGTLPRIVHGFVSWADGGNFTAAFPNAVLARGAMPMLTWSPFDWRADVDQPAYANRVIVKGAYNDLIKQWGRDLALWGKPLYLRIAHEMNGDWYPWSPGQNGNTVADFLAMWRHIVTTMRAQGATNVRFVWSPNVMGKKYGAQPFAAMYPGDAYVDWVGLDGYNWGSVRNIGWESFSDIFADSYNSITSLTHKPLMIPEVGCAEAGGDKAEWIAQTLLFTVPQQFQRIRGIAWSNADISVPGDADFRVNTSQTALSAFTMIAASPRYQGSLP